MRRAFLFAALAMALPFIGSSLASSLTSAQGQQTAKVSYAPVAGGDYKIDHAHSLVA